GLDDHASFGNVRLDAVDGDFNHYSVLTLQIFGHHTLLVLDVVCEFVAEVLDEAAHGHGRRVTQGTDRAPHDVLRNRVEHVEIFGPAAAVLDAIHHAIQPPRAFAARRALTATFFVIEIREPQERLDHAAGFVHDD